MVRLNLCPSRILTNEEQHAMDKKRRKREREDISKLTGVTPSVSREDLVEPTHEGPSTNHRQGEMSADAGAAPTQQNSNDSPTMEAGTTVSTSRLGAIVPKDVRRSPRTSQASGGARVTASTSRNSFGQRSVPEEQDEQRVEAVPTGKRSKRLVDGKQGSRSKKKVSGSVAKPPKKSTAKRGAKGKRTQGNKANAVSSFSSIFAGRRMPKTISSIQLKPSTYDALAPPEVTADVGADLREKPRAKPKVSEVGTSKANDEVSQDVSAMEKPDSPVANTDKPSKKKNTNTKAITKKKTGKVAQKPKAVAKATAGKKDRTTKGVHKPKSVAKKPKSAHAVRKTKQSTSVKPPNTREKAAIKKIKSLLPPFPKKKGQGAKPLVSKRKMAAAKDVKRKKTAA